MHFCIRFLHPNPPINQKSLLNLSTEYQLSFHRFQIRAIYFDVNLKMLFHQILLSNIMDFSTIKMLVIFK